MGGTEEDKKEPRMPHAPPEVLLQRSQPTQVHTCRGSVV